MNLTLPLHQHARSQPEKPALIGDRQTLSYQQLDQLVWQGAAYFREAGLTAGDRVMLAVFHPVLSIVSGLALARLGVAYALVSPIESALASETLARRIGATVFITHARRPEIQRYAQVVVDAGAISRGGKGRPGLMAEDPEQLWAFMSSSGTTGKPKLFTASHARWFKSLRPLELGFPSGPADVFLSLIPPFFMGGAGLIMHCLTGGGTVVLPHSLATEALVAQMTTHRVTRTITVPSTLRTLLNCPGHAEAVAGLTMLGIGGSVVSRSLRAQVLELTPGLTVLYGCNESGLLTSTHSLTGDWQADTVGRPIPFGQFEIVDDSGRPAAPNVVGEVRAKREDMIERYFDDPAADARFFRDGWFYPGDLACLSADGQVLFKGRSDDMMIFHGVNIYPVEIENCLNEHAEVVESAAFPLPAGEMGDMPVAAVRLRSEVSEAELVEFCRERLGMRSPRRVVAVDDFPRNQMGKPLKREMATKMAELASTSAAA
jgi:acyl-CoA synthetase (AMP-forming)/AMP-acid ligase II